MCVYRIPGSNDHRVEITGSSKRAALFLQKVRTEGGLVMTEKKQQIRDYLAITVGTILIAFAIKIFLIL